MRVRFPSGKRFNVYGDWLGVKQAPDNLGNFPIILEQNAKNSSWLDPRAVVLNAYTGEVLYNPKEHLTDMGEKYRTWMEHGLNEWPTEKDFKND